MSKIPIGEHTLLRELGAISDRLRALRTTQRPNGTEIRPLEAEMSLKWQELRLLRAGLPTEELPPYRSRRGGQR